MMKRRDFIGGFAVVAVLRPVGGVAQVASKRPLVVYLIGGSKSAADRMDLVAEVGLRAARSSRSRRIASARRCERDCRNSIVMNLFLH
jgi:hypothetical protein